VGADSAPLTEDVVDLESGYGIKAAVLFAQAALRAGIPSNRSYIEPDELSLFFDPGVHQQVKV
jgi:hypothetical protein